jgi:hypothetical protein
MSVNPKELEKFSGKQVILTVKAEDGTAKEIPGKVEGASEVGLAFKEKGKREVQLVEPDQIEDISEAPTEAKKVTQKKLKPVKKEQVRQHLADRHGYNRSEINSMTDDAAFDFHEKLDHKDLGHKHVAESEATEGGTEPADESSAA